jgi:hypothetical protein
MALPADKDRRHSKSLPRSRVTARQHSAAEWKTKRGIITRLYCEEKLTVAELIRHLHSEGFGVKYVKSYFLVSAFGIRTLQSKVRRGSIPMLSRNLMMIVRSLR